jgi:hypothetical protein
MNEVLALQSALKPETEFETGPAWCSIISLACTITTK